MFTKKFAQLFIFIYCFFIFPGKKVWDEVAEHSKEFIQEYLEEFPNVRQFFLNPTNFCCEISKTCINYYEMSPLLLLLKVK